MHLFVSTSDMTPSPLRSSLLGWRTDVGGPEGLASPSLRITPEDATFREGPLYLAVYGYTSVADYNVTCSLSTTAVGVPSVRVGAQFSGNVGSAGNYTSFRLVPDNSFTTVVFTVSLASPTSDQPPLGIYLTRTNPSASTANLPFCTPGSIGAKRECIVQVSLYVCLMSDV